MDDDERAKLEQANVIPIMYLHLEEARRHAPDDITAADLENLVGPISDRVQDDIPWSEAIEQAVHEYVQTTTRPYDPPPDMPEDPFSESGLK